MSDELVKILTNISRQMGGIDEKLKSFDIRLQNIEEQDEVQNELLAEHIKGVDTNISRLEEERLVRISQLKAISDRIKTVEETPLQPKHVFSYLFKLSAVCGAVLSIVALYKVLY